MPAVSKSFPAEKAIALEFELLPVVNSKKQFLGIVLKSDLEKLLNLPADNSFDGNAFKAENPCNSSEPLTTEIIDKPTIGKADEGNLGADVAALERTLLLRRVGLVIYSTKMMELVDLCLRVARFDSTVLISGESGVGKELMAKLMHDQSPRSLGQFVKINCGAIPENLLESELFGYEAGAFTGANRQGKLGMFELANGGTLFLDEIGELPLSLQVKLLRAIQEQEFVRVGGVKTRKVDVRFIAATNRDLAQMVKEGRFREDLYYRLNVIPMTVPPLRERKEDILPLVHHFQLKLTQRFKLEREFTPQVLRTFLNYPWPGNVRELENVVERLFVTSLTPVIGHKDLPEKLLSNPKREAVQLSGLLPLKDAVMELEQKLIGEALKIYGTTYKAAKALGIDQSTLVRKLSAFKEAKSW